MSKKNKIEGLFSKVPGSCNLRLHSAYNVKVSPAWKIEKRYINDYHLLFVRGGNGHYCLDGQDVQLKRGRVIFVGGTAYYAARQDISDPPFIVPIRFGFYDNKSGKQLEPLADKLYYSYNSLNADYLEFLFTELFRLYSSNDTLYMSSLLHTLLCLTLYEAGRNNSEPGDNLEKIREWIRTNPLERTGIDELAKRAGISRKYFTRLFKLRYGVSPKSYQVLQRMNYAKYLLQESNISVKEAAVQTGYSDQYIFSKQFKSIVGCAPSQIHN